MAFSYTVIDNNMKLVRKRVFLSHLYIKMLILPRQARDKHKENSKQDAFLQVRRCGREGVLGGILPLPRYEEMYTILV